MSLLEIAETNLVKLKAAVDANWAEVTADIIAPDSSDQNVQMKWLQKVWDRLHTQGKYEPERVRQFFIVVSTALADANKRKI